MGASFSQIYEYHGEAKLKSTFTYSLFSYSFALQNRVPKILLKDSAVVFAVSIKILTVQGGMETDVQSKYHSVYKI